MIDKNYFYVISWAPWQTATNPQGYEYKFEKQHKYVSNILVTRLQTHYFLEKLPLLYILNFFSELSQEVNLSLALIHIIQIDNDIPKNSPTHV